MSKKLYHIASSDLESVSIIQRVVKRAALSNFSAEHYCNIQDLAMICQARLIEEPILYTDWVSCTIIGENVLHIDQKIGGEWKTVLIIKEVEFFELEEVNI